MKNAIAWIKSNPISVVSAVVVVLAFGVLGWVLFVAGNGLKHDVGKYVTKISEIKKFEKQNVEVPPENPDAEMVRVSSITFNQPDIDAMKEIDERMDAEYSGIFNTAVARNRAGKQVLVAGLFPDWGDALDLPFIARERFFEAFDDMFGPHDPEALGPRMHAGMPPAPQRVELALAEAKQGVLASHQFSNVKLSQAQMQKQQEDLLEVEQRRLLEVLADQAMSIHVYANNNPFGQDYPFDIRAVPDPMAGGVAENSDPTAHQLWEGQLELWVQQDIVAAIADANRVSDPQANVLSSPLKRLIRIEMIPGYVGLHTRGGVLKESAQRGAMGMYSAPAGGMTDNAEGRQSDNFYVGPTGRVSNALYDVRHARLTAIVGFQQLPRLFESISKVNFMTVVDVAIEGVDEYVELYSGYFYGPEDVVQASIVIETIWLREWTEQLMPDQTKKYVGLLEPDQGMENAGYGGGMKGGYPGMGGPMGSPMGGPMGGWAPPQK